MWPEGEEPRRYEWKEGTMIVPPNLWFHQHFNTGTTPARYLAFKAEGVAIRNAQGVPKAWISQAPRRRPDRLCRRVAAGAAVVRRGARRARPRRRGWTRPTPRAGRPAAQACFAGHKWRRCATRRLVVCAPPACWRRPSAMRRSARVPRVLLLLGLLRPVEDLRDGRLLRGVDFGDGRRRGLRLYGGGLHGRAARARAVASPSRALSAAAPSAGRSSPAPSPVRARTPTRRSPRRSR